MLINFIIIALTTIFILTGIIGSVLPVIPGPFLVLAGILLYAWHTDFTVINLTVIVWISLLAVFSFVFDYLASMFGAKRFGASVWGLIGAFAGGVLGFLLGGFAGILIGPFFGAFLLEILHGRTVNSSFKIGLGTLVGFLGGAVARFVAAVTMVGIFLIRIFC